MGRKLRRVPMDFSWPLHMVWKGYICPYRSQTCEACDGTAYNTKTKQIADDFYDFNKTGRRWSNKITQDECDALVAAGRLRLFDSATRTWVSVPRTAQEVNAANGPNSSMVGDLAHDGLNRCILIETRAKRLGVYGHCPACNGEGEIWVSDEIKNLASNWRRTKPPTGEGFQLWETTSEGSPVSPVFSTLDELCSWLAENRASVFGSSTATKAEWLEMLSPEGMVAKTEVIGGQKVVFL